MSFLMLCVDVIVVHALYPVSRFSSSTMNLKVRSLIQRRQFPWLFAHQLQIGLSWSNLALYQGRFGRKFKKINQIDLRMLFETNPYKDSMTSELEEFVIKRTTFYWYWFYVTFGIYRTIRTTVAYFFWGQETTVTVPVPAGTVLIPDWYRITKKTCNR